MDALRRKIARRSTGQTGQGDADRAFRLSFARAARDVLGLVVALPQIAVARRSLAEVAELPPDRALIALLDRDGDGVGIMVLSAPVLAGLVEHLTTGQITAAPPLPRRPTRTDAAMLSGLIDAALSGLAGGWRYAGMLDDPRPLGLLLDDADHDVVSATVSLADGAKEGAVLLALPDLPDKAQAPVDAPQADDFPAALAARVEAAETRMDAVIARLSLPLSRLSGLMAGEVLPLVGAGIDHIRLIGVDGRVLAQGRLGQHRGMRAVRIAEQAAPVPAVLAVRQAG